MVTGNTPLVRIDSLSDALGVEILVRPFTSASLVVSYGRYSDVSFIVWSTHNLCRLGKSGGKGQVGRALIQENVDNNPFTVS
jgi:hypothetical protein